MRLRPWAHVLTGGLGEQGGRGAWDEPVRGSAAWAWDARGETILTHTFLHPGHRRHALLQEPRVRKYLGMLVCGHVPHQYKVRRRDTRYRESQRKLVFLSAVLFAMLCILTVAFAASHDTQQFFPLVLTLPLRQLRRTHLHNGK